MALQATHHAHYSVLQVFAASIRASILQTPTPVLPRLSQQLPILERLRQRLRQKYTLAAAFVPIPNLIDSLWDGLLKAVPKKKTSHSKKRHRQMAGKALKDVTAINKCSACGRPKRAHFLCPYCVASIKQWLGNGFKTKEQVQQQKLQDAEDLNEHLRSIGKKPLPLPDQQKDLSA